MNNVNEIIIAAKASDDAAIEKLYLMHYKLLQKICSNYSRKFSVGFDDVFQEASLNFFRVISRYNLEYNVKFSTYLYTSTNLYLSDVFRLDGIVKKPRRIYTEEKRSGGVNKVRFSQIEDWDSSTEDDEASYTEEEVIKCFEHAFDKSKHKEEYTMLCFLRYKEIPFSEIAKELNISEPTIYERLAAAGKLINRYLGTNYSVRFSTKEKRRIDNSKSRAI
jgi:RNA polymerase sigma factor (sigma-70 family)